MSWSASIAIEELDSDRNVLRVLTLVGPAMPLQHAPWASESTMATRYYAGNPDEATQTYLVRKDMPSDWEFEWNLTRMNRRPSRYVESQQGGAATTVVAPGFLVDVLDDMQLKGRRLRVTWSTDSDDPTIARTVLREGRIKSFTAKYVRSTDIEASISFAWCSRGGTQQRVASTRDSQQAGATSALQTAMAGTQTAIQNIIAAQNIPTEFNLGQLEKIAAAPLALVSALDTEIEDGLFSFQQIAGIVTEFKNLPFNLAAQTLGTASDVIAAANLFADQISATPAEQAVLTSEVAILTSTWAQFAAILDNNDTIVIQAQSTQAQMRATLAAANAELGKTGSQAASGTRASNILAIRRVVAGDTPASLSNLYYGTPDHDLDIMRTNGLPWYQVTLQPGQLLVIPQINAQQTPQ